MSPEVQNRGISGPTKRTYVFQKSKKKFKKGYITISCLTCAASGRDGSSTVHRGVSEVAGLTGVCVTDCTGWTGGALGWTGWKKIQVKCYQYVAYLLIGESNLSKDWELTDMGWYFHSTALKSSLDLFFPTTLLSVSFSFCLCDEYPFYVFMQINLKRIPLHRSFTFIKKNEGGSMPSTFYHTYRLL